MRSSAARPDADPERATFAPQPDRGGDARRRRGPTRARPRWCPVARAIRTGTHPVIQAGTGTGKSLGLPGPLGLLGHARW